jgi:hypothetical protein
MRAVLAFIATVPGMSARTAATLNAHPTISTIDPISAVRALQITVTLRGPQTDGGAASLLRPSIGVAVSSRRAVVAVRTRREVTAGRNPSLQRSAIVQ